MSDRPLRERIEDRPIRDRLASSTDKIPEGPLGKLGGGNLLGAGGFVAVEATRPVWQFIPGVKQPGYKIISHGSKYIGNGVEQHSIKVAAVSEDVAEFAAEYVAAPSNVDYLRSDIENTQVEVETERGSYSTFTITVDLVTEGANG